MGGAGSSRFRGVRNPPPGVVTDVVRPYVEGSDWDRPHRLLTLCWDGERAWVDQEAAAPLTMHPDRFGMFIERRAWAAYERQRVAVEAGAAPTLYAVGLVAEGHAVTGLGEDAPEWERARFRRDRRERRFHERGDAVETRSAWVADIDLRLHYLEVRADRPGEAVLCRSDGLDDTPHAGRLTVWLASAALTYAELLYGDALPVPGGAVTGEVAEFRRRGGARRR